MSDTCLSEVTKPDLPADREQLPASVYVATAREALWNCNGNYANRWYKDEADPNDASGNYAFQRLRQTWFTPKIDPKFKLHRDDKVYAIGSRLWRSPLLHCSRE